MLFFDRTIGWVVLIYGEEIRTVRNPINSVNPAPRDVIMELQFFFFSKCHLLIQALSMFQKNRTSCDATRSAARFHILGSGCCSAAMCSGGLWKNHLSARCCCGVENLSALIMPERICTHLLSSAFFTRWLLACHCAHRLTDT